MVRKNSKRTAIQKFEHPGASPELFNASTERAKQARDIVLSGVHPRIKDDPAIQKVLQPEMTHRYDTGAVHPEAALAEKDPWVCHDSYYPVYRSLKQAGLPMQDARLKLSFGRVGIVTMLARKINYALSSKVRELLL